MQYKKCAESLKFCIILTEERRKGDREMEKKKQLMLSIKKKKNFFLFIKTNPFLRWPETFSTFSCLFRASDVIDFLSQLLIYHVAAVLSFCISSRRLPVTLFSCRYSFYFVFGFAIGACLRKTLAWPPPPPLSRFPLPPIFQRPLVNPKSVQRNKTANWFKANLINFEAEKNLKVFSNEVNYDFRITIRQENRSPFRRCWFWIRQETRKNKCYGNL